MAMNNQVKFDQEVLFPISVGNRAFTSERTIRMIKRLTSEGYTKFLFLIADQMHLFNRSRQIKNGTSFAEVVNDFETRSREVETRRRWIDRLMRGGELSSVAYRVHSSSAFLDVAYETLHRKLLIAFATVPSFRDAIAETARAFLSMKFGEEFAKRWEELSVFYLLEEIALNVRIRVWEKIETECYLGTFHEPLLGVYDGRYGFSVEDLTGKDLSSLHFHFRSFRQEEC